MSNLIPPPPPFEYDIDTSENNGQKWSIWLRRLNNWTISTELSGKFDALKIAALLSVARPKVEEVNVINKVTATKTYNDATDLNSSQVHIMFTVSGRQTP